MSKPARWLAAVAGGGGGAGALVPEKLIQLDGKDLDILIYPMDLLISGKPALVARARAAMASRLTTSAAHLTVSAEAQGIEDRLAALARPADADPDHPPRFDDAAAAEFSAIDNTLSTLKIPYEEWEVLYRQRLQVERDLRAGAMAGDAVVGAETPGVRRDGPLGVLGDLGRLVRTGAEVVLEAAADQRTIEAIDRVAGSEWRVAAQAASVASAAAKEVIQARDDADEALNGPVAPPPRAAEALEASGGRALEALEPEPKPEREPTTQRTEPAAQERSVTS